MTIYVLIIVCLYTLIMGIIKLIQSIRDEDSNEFLAGLLHLILGIIAIVFQSNNL